jgi:hypothetical protein
MGYETDTQNVPEGFTHLGEETSHGILAAAEATDSKSPKVYYPELHFDGKHAEHLIKHLAKHGVAHVHYKKVSESTHHHVGHDGKEKTSHRVGIQIHGIKPVTEHQSEEKMVRHTAKENPEDSIEKGLLAAESESTDTTA